MLEKLKQLEILAGQVAARLQTAQNEAASLRQKVRLQQDTISRLKENESELKNLREWKKNTISQLKRLESRIEKELARAQEEEKELL